MKTYNDYIKTDVSPAYETPEPIPFHPEETVLPDPVDAPPPPERVHMTPEEAWDHREEQAEQVVAAVQEYQADQPAPSGRDKAMSYLQEQVEVTKSQSKVKPR